ncbi:MAG: hypothetical protein ACKVRN_10190 [Pyrinomonadaceae bacterium]
MNDLSAAILGCLPIVLFVVLMVYGLSWLGRNLLPRNSLLRRLVRSGFRFLFIEPFRKSYQAIRWLSITTVNSNPVYRTHELYFDRYPVTPLELYTLIEEVFATRQIIGIQLSRVSRLEWHLLSSRRVYLIIRFRDAVCFISGVRAGTGLLVSWRYCSMPGRLSLVLFQIPFVGVLAERIISPQTFYRTDLYFALEQAIRESVLEATNMLAQRGVRPLTANEQQPLLREFYG